MPTLSSLPSLAISPQSATPARLPIPARPALRLRRLGPAAAGAPVRIPAHEIALAPTCADAAERPAAAHDRSLQRIAFAAMALSLGALSGALYLVAQIP